MVTQVAASSRAAEIWLDRDLQWLEFNRRVLHEAVDDRTPLLERVKFLAIFSSNLDEFFMKRVGNWKSRMAVDGEASPSSSDSLRRLHTVRKAVLPMLATQAEVWTERILPELKKNGILLLSWSELSEFQRQAAGEFFRKNVFPVLTPLAVDPGHPFPFISNLSTSLGILLQHPQTEERLFARVKVPTPLSQLVPLPDDRADGKAGPRQCFLRLTELVQNHLDQLFPGMQVVEVMPFRITRSVVLELDDDDEPPEDLAEMVEEEVRQRRFERAVRLEYGPGASQSQIQLLLRKLNLTETDLYEVKGELDFTSLFSLAGLNRPELHDPPWTPMVPPEMDEEADPFAVIRAGDFLVHHPYESFEATVERFIQTAADDPRVLAIKMTVYRVGSDTPFLDTLIRAAEKGKQVACLVEVTARFDEQHNLAMAQSLEKAGVHVVYGVIGLKTHCKTALVVRQEEDGLRCYAHIGTGNYHVKTARLYTDLGLFTCNPALTEDVVNLFHFLTGRSLKREYTGLLVAPVNMRPTFLAMIEREIEHQKAGRPARILAKMNQLEDREVCTALGQASQAGVQIDLIVRGFAVLAPGVPGLTENIRIRSIIGRFLEHSRIFYFQNGAEQPVEGAFYIGSADWMTRNLSERVEAVTPIEVPALRQRLWDILQIMLEDQRQAWDMQSDGTYVQRQPTCASGPAAIGTHQALMELTRRTAGLASGGG